MKYECSYILRVNAEQCRAILRLDLSYNFRGVIKSEINENHFQIKNLAVNTGSVFQPNLAQLVSIYIVENDDNSTTLTISSVPNAVVANNKIEIWQTALEQLVGIVWTDIYKAADIRYKNAFYSNSNAQTNTEQLSTSVLTAQNSSIPSTVDIKCNNIAQEKTSQTNKQKKILVGFIGVIIAVILAIILFPQLIGGDTEKYVGSSTSWDVVITLNKSDSTFTIKETNLKTNKITTLSGTFQLLGTNKNIVKFNPSTGSSFQCEILVNIHGTPFISFAGVISDYPACYKS